MVRRFGTRDGTRTFCVPKSYFFFISSKKGQYTGWYTLYHTYRISQSSNCFQIIHENSTCRHIYNLIFHMYLSLNFRNRTVAGSSSICSEFDEIENQSISSNFEDFSRKITYNGKQTRRNLFRHSHIDILISWPLMEAFQTRQYFILRYLKLVIHRSVRLQVACHYNVFCSSFMDVSIETIYISGKSVIVLSSQNFDIVDSKSVLDECKQLDYESYIKMCVNY